MEPENNNNDDAHSAKRMRLETEQRTAFEEDMALIRSAIRDGSSQADRTSAVMNNNHDTAVAVGGGGEIGNGSHRHQQGGESTFQQQQQMGGESTLQDVNPIAGPQHASLAFRPPQAANGLYHQRTSNTNDDSDEDGEGNWLQNFTPHHTRVGGNYQVTELPTPSSWRPEGNR